MEGLRFLLPTQRSLPATAAQPGAAAHGAAQDAAPGPIRVPSRALGCAQAQGAAVPSARGPASPGLGAPQFWQLKELRADISTRASTALITHI